MTSETTDPVFGFGGKQWEVHKFGGTSVENAECYQSAAAIVEEQMGIREGSTSPGNDLNVAVVVSAMGGKPKTTDLLLSTVEAAANRDSVKVEEAIAKITEKHVTCLEVLFAEETQMRLKTLILKDLEDIRDILKTVSLMKWQAARISELVSGYGELWSAQILSALLQLRSDQRGGSDQPYFTYLDARRVITIDEDVIKDGAVCWDICSEKLQKVYDEEAKSAPEGHTMHFVITGYVASNIHGVATTLQRDGSDYSAAIMGKLLQSRNVTIWTDVDGVLSADPRRVPGAFVIPEVSYSEAMELAYFGAKVIHPKTMQPAISANPQIPIYIRNTFHPAFRGTRIYTTSTTHTDKDRAVCGFSSIEHIALINVEGSGLIGVPGVAKRLFGTLESVGVNVILISQASSEHSITFATVEEQAERAKLAIEEEFSKELNQSRISQVEVQSPCSIIAAVGDGMKLVAGVSGRFFSALGDSKINILAISQGCSERNISAVVFTADSTRALRAVHAAFHLSHTMVRVGVIGMGELGDSLLKLLQTQRAKLREKFEVDLQVCSVLEDESSSEYVALNNDHPGSADSITSSAYKMLTGGPTAKTTIAFDSESNVASLLSGGIAGFKDRLVSDDIAHHVIFDCTGSEAVGKLHAAWLEDGVNVATANNWGLAGSREQRDAITAAEMAHGKQSAKYLREVTVGGALPVINTVRSLLNSGDKIRRIDGMFSVSMSYILFRISPPFNADHNSQFDESISKAAFRGDLSVSPYLRVGEACSFAQAVQEAVEFGLMEDDPAKDFNNEYTSRCLMILAKELGLENTTSPQEIQEGSDKIVEGNIDFSNISEAMEQKVQGMVKAARDKGCVLRSIASVDVAQAVIELKLVEVPNSHVFAVTPPSCECVRFFTQRHAHYPLIIQGPSAGADSTASALLAEFLSHMRSKVGPRSGALSRANSVSQFST
jgi:aspartokinase/homoserine dehydrogenase 1